MFFIFVQPVEAQIGGIIYKVGGISTEFGGILAQVGGNPVKFGGIIQKVDGILWQGGTTEAKILETC